MVYILDTSSDDSSFFSSSLTVAFSSVTDCFNIWLHSTHSCMHIESVKLIDHVTVMPHDHVSSVFIQYSSHAKGVNLFFD